MTAKIELGDKVKDLSFCDRFSMSNSNLFKWRHYQSDIILRCVRWYLSFPLSYRQLEEIVTERGLSVDHSTI